MGSESMTKYYVFAFKAVTDITATLGTPALCAYFLGQFIEQRYFDHHFVTWVLLVLAFGLTAVVLVRKIQAYGRDFQKLVNPPA